MKDPKRVNKTVYPKAGGHGEFPIFKANLFVEWMDGVTNNILATRCRQYINIPKDTRTVSEELKFFIGGRYILDDGSRKKIQSKKQQRPADSDEESEPGRKKAAK